MGTNTTGRPARLYSRALLGVTVAAGLTLSVTHGPVAYAAYAVGMTAITFLALAVVLYEQECRRLAEPLDPVGPTVALAGLAVAALGFVLETDPTALKWTGAAMTVTLFALSADVARRHAHPDLDQDG